MVLDTTLVAKLLMEMDGIRELDNCELIDKYKRKYIATEICKKCKEDVVDTVLMKIEDLSSDSLEILHLWANDEPIDTKGRYFSFSELWKELYEGQKTAVHPFFLILEVVDIFQKYNSQEGNPKNIKENAFYAVKRIGCHDIII